MQFNTVSFIVSLGVFQGIFMALLLFCLKGEKTASNRILATLLLVLSWILACMVFLMAGFSDINLIRLVMTPPLFIIGPLFFLYLRKYLGNESAVSFWNTAHPLPLMLVVAYYLPKYIFPGYLAFINYRFMTFFFWYAFLVHFAVYLFIHLRAIKRATCIYNGWTRFLYASFATAFVVAVGITVYDMARIFIPFKGVRLTEVGISFFCVILICAVSFKGLTDPTVFFGLRKKAGIVKPTMPSTLPMRDSILTTATRLMEEERAYLDPCLTLPDLAAKVGIPRSDLSAAINSGTDRNFYEFVNGYRVGHAKTLLAERKSLNVLDVAYESGFLNKSTFNEAFKREVGCTPSEYRRRTRAD